MRTSSDGLDAAMMVAITRYLRALQERSGCGGGLCWEVGVQWRVGGVRGKGVRAGGGGGG
eukprot:scaffold49904_cov63-Phaeocystis_antarctica.AAC.1